MKEKIPEEFERFIQAQLNLIVQREEKDLRDRVKKCPALKSRSKELCGTWFMASRPDQVYCSARCLSRMTSRNYRNA